MITLEIFGIILSLMAVCSSSNLRNDQEGKNTINTLSTVKQLGSPEPNLNIPINTKKTYQNWLLDGVNRLPINFQQINQNKEISKDFKQLNENQNLNIRPIDDRNWHNRELNSHVGNRFDNKQIRDFANDESFNNNPLLRSSQIPRVVNQPVNINEHLYQPERSFLNKFDQGPGSLITKQESQLERGILRKEELGNLDLLKEHPMRNQEAIRINSYHQSPNIRDFFPNDNNFNNIGLPKTEQIFPTINNQYEQVAATIHKNYGNQDILNNPYIQNILNKFKPKNGYLVIYPNGTVEHMDNIEVLAQNYPNLILVDYPRDKQILESTSSKNPLLTNDDQISKTYKNSKMDTVVTNKMDDHKIMPETLTTILSMDFNTQINTEKQEIKSESSILTTSSTQEGADKYEHQTTKPIDHLDTKNNENKQPAPVLTLNENTSNIYSDTETSLDDKKQTTSSPTPFQEVTKENKNKKLINHGDIFTIKSTDKEDDQELKNKPNSSKTEKNSNKTTLENTNSEKDSDIQENVSNKLNGTSNTELTSQSEKDESSIFNESTIGSEEDAEAKNSSTTQTNIESSQTSSEINEPKQCKEEDTETAQISNKWRQITTQGQVFDSLYLLNSPMTKVKIIDAEGQSHECVQIGESTSPLSYIICSVVT